MPTPQDLGIRFPIYLGGYNLALTPATMSEVPFRAETAERMANTFGVIDRPYVFTSQLNGGTGAGPDVVQKFAWTLAWPNVNSSDYDTYAEIESLPGYFDFCLWKSLIETFSGDATSTDFFLLRRIASVALTPPAGVTWTPVTKVNGTIVTNPTFSTGDTTLGTTKAHFGAAPSAVASNIRISYTPLFSVRVVSPKRDLSIPFTEARTLSLEEI